MPADSGRIILALDLPDRPACERLLERLDGLVRVVKVGPVLFHREGPALLEWLASRRMDIFLDMKFHDIPNTVAGAVRAACEGTRLAFLTIHSSGGRKMVRAAAEEISRLPGGRRPKLLAVTLLTSLTAEDLAEIGFSGRLEDRAGALARLAVDAGADGVVCSPLETRALRAAVPGGTLLVVPGIRSSHDPASDQKRSATAREAFDAGADYIVVGRPVTQARDPAEAFRALSAG